MSEIERKLLDRIRHGLLIIEKLESENHALRRPQSEPIAIVGLACRFPRGESPELFWNLLQDGSH
ncbi:MAG: beta-ketoacyl synthase N-terminal-like domain-containing protein, partial [Gemmataceae bacterium]